MSSRRIVIGWILVLLMLLVFLQCKKKVKSEELIIDLNQGWKFKTGDSGVYKNPQFDDSEWINLKVDKIWEAQGFDPYDGYAWYRVSVKIPSLLKKTSHLKRYLRICLGKINNFDQSFLNGKIFGINGLTVSDKGNLADLFIKANAKLWNIQRVYLIPVDDPRIKWDQENLLAVRVYDEGGQGGIWSGNLNIRMENVKDYIQIDNQKTSFLFTQDGWGKKITLSNTSRGIILNGIFSVTGIHKLSKAKIYQKSEPLSLNPEIQKIFQINIPHQEQSCIITYQFDFADTNESLKRVEETPYILTPKPPLEPKINHPRIFGARVGHPILFNIPTSGERPITFTAKRLPYNLKLDQNSGILNGTVYKKGKYRPTITARNDYGTDSVRLEIIIGEKIALTPPLGYNSWNSWGLSVSQEKILKTAEAFVEKGLINYGWSYINIDDGWEIQGDLDLPKRDRKGNILTNEKFPDMKNLGDQIHKMGLKFGIYTSPGPLTCGGYTASYQHEAQDIRTFASWGVDYIKYDWCSYEKIAQDHSLGELMKPYLVMREALSKVKRDMVYSLCQYGMGKIWEWGEEVGGNLWRTTGDIIDTWESMTGIGFSQVENGSYAGPGHWNDPDMLVIGWVGWGPDLHPTGLTPDEQYTHISLWSLLSSPLLIGCDMERLDEFTLNLLTNAEVLAINQDPLGKQANLVIKRNGIQVWKKNLKDEAIAVGIFNLDSENQDYTLDLKDLDIHQDVKIRDLWRQNDLGIFDGLIKIRLPSHGVILLKIVQLR